MQKHVGLFKLCDRIIAGVVIVALFSGCAAAAFRQDFSSFDSAYADMLNHQMLLNLARLDNGHPAQFLAIGSIQSNFSFTGNASGGVTGTSTTTTNGQALYNNPVGNILHIASDTVTTASAFALGRGANVSLGAVNNPQFQWIPLNNESNARQLLEPISAEVFYTLYQQGYPIDQLLRVMVERIETTIPGEGELVLVNSPTNGNVKSFGRFLRVCAMLREMQRSGALILETRRQFTPLAQGLEYTDASADEKNSHGKGTDEKTGDQQKPTRPFQPTPEQLVSAEKDGFKWEKNAATGGWQLGKFQNVPRFYLKPGSTAAASQSIENITEDKQAIANLVGLLEAGVTVKTTVREETSPSCLVLRSFSRVLSATASEQSAFDTIQKRNDPLFAKLVPQSEQQPVLRTRWAGHKVALEPPLTKLQYAGKSYEITDPVHNPLDHPLGVATWNRDVYRLIVALNSQVAVDISKFQQQILQIRQQ